MFWESWSNLVSFLLKVLNPWKLYLRFFPSIHVGLKYIRFWHIWWDYLLSYHHVSRKNNYARSLGLPRNSSYDNAKKPHSSQAKLFEPVLSKFLATKSTLLLQESLALTNIFYGWRSSIPSISQSLVGYDHATQSSTWIRTKQSSINWLPYYKPAHEMTKDTFGSNGKIGWIVCFCHRGQISCIVVAHSSAYYDETCQSYPFGG